MASTQTGIALRRVHDFVAAEQAAGLPDPDLLARFTGAHDEGAFTALVKRHGPLVLGVCRRVLRHEHDAEDAFQATFLTLAKKAASIAQSTSLPCWLYRVAYHTAVKAKARFASRKTHAARVEPAGGADPLAEVTGRELLTVLDEELQRLPERQRAAVVLCYLEGQTRDEAARQLGWSLGTLKRRLEQARAGLRTRLARRGLTLPGTLLAAGLCGETARAAIPGSLAETTVRAALTGGASASVGGAASALTQAALPGLLPGMGARVALVLVLAGAALVGAAIAAGRLPTPQAPTAAAAVQAQEKKPADGAPKQQPAGKQEVVVTGRVLDADGKPVKGARVGVVALPEDWWKLGGPDGERMVPLEQTHSGADGTYRLRAPRPTGKEVYPTMLLARAKGHGAGLLPLTADGKPGGDIRLPREQVRRGRFIDLQGQPVKGATVHIAFVAFKHGDKVVGVAQPSKASPLWFEPAVTDAKGRFRLRGIGPEHEVGVLVRDDRFKPERLELWARVKDRTAEVAHTLAPAQRIVGRVTYADTGKPVAGGEVRFTGTSARTDKDGRFDFNPFREEHGGILAALAPAGAPYLGMLKWLPQPKVSVQRETADLKLPRGVIVRGTVKAAGSAETVSGAVVYFIPQRRENPHYLDYTATGPVFPVTSGPAGRFEIVVLPGPGHLVVKGPTAAYIPLELSMLQMREARPGGRRHYAHGALRTEFKPGDGPRQLELTIRPGVRVCGKLVGPDGVAVAGAQMLTRLSTSAPMVIEEVRGVDVPAAGFELSGCDPKKAYPVVFLQETKGWGAVLQASGKQQGKPLTVRLQRCGSAKVRFLDKEGQPLAGHWAKVEMVFAPGASPYDGKAFERGELAADTVNLANIHRYGYQLDKGRTDAQGRITLPNLVPGVTYRLVAGQLGGRVLHEFSVRPGEVLDLKDVKVAAE